MRGRAGGAFLTEHVQLLSSEASGAAVETSAVALERRPSRPRPTGLLLASFKKPAAMLA